MDTAKRFRESLRESLLQKESEYTAHKQLIGECESQLRDCYYVIKNYADAKQFDAQKETFLKNISELINKLDFLARTKSHI